MFSALLRPGQGFKEFQVLRREGEVSKTGRARTGNLEPQGKFLGIISQASPKEIEQHKQLGTPITHTIVQRGTKDRAFADDVLELTERSPRDGSEVKRRFLVKGSPHNPGELDHFLVYKVEERMDLQ